MTKIDQLFSHLWADYSTLNPIANQIHNLLETRGEKVLNDHVAFRTYNSSNINIEKFAQAFKDLGYKEKGDYHFTEKKLYAKHYEHEDPNQPKVFISELLTEKFSPRFQEIVRNLTKQVPESVINSWDFSVSGVQWNKIDSKTYEELRSESDYGAWLAVNGFRANHFTVNANALKSFKSLQELNSFLKNNGFTLNKEGGEIKGTPAELLEQSSTIANKVEFELADGKFTLPGCYYEFALRYPKPDGRLYTGFIAASADKIFESTNLAM